MGGSNSQSPQGQAKAAGPAASKGASKAEPGVAIGGFARPMPQCVKRKVMRGVGLSAGFFT